ncbi:hypothetical protein [uncultured Hyphomonas sp.]|uniref:hypothetical protein n=1 Tax=uncultured Hyphomonas sp. TaxID=225298 RepID=UPI002AAAFE47|nr:hypothetical protein [uncultured Hyphomonas sp.]
MSFLRPPPGLYPQFVAIWPLIWVQVLLLRLAVRAAYGRGVKYRWSVSPNCRVFLVAIDWIPGQKSERVSLKPCTHFNDRLAAACDGRAATPAYLRIPAIIAPLGQSMRTERLAQQFAVLQADASARRLDQAHLPLPET